MEVFQLRNKIFFMKKKIVIIAGGDGDIGFDCVKNF